MDIQGSLFQTVTDDMQYMFGLGVSYLIFQGIRIDVGLYVVKFFVPLVSNRIIFMDSLVILFW